MDPTPSFPSFSKNVPFVYEMFNKIRKLETFLPKTLYNFVIVCYNDTWESLHTTKPAKFRKNSVGFHMAFPVILYNNNCYSYAHVSNTYAQEETNSYDGHENSRCR